MSYKKYGIELQSEKAIQLKSDSKAILETLVENLNNYPLEERCFILSILTREISIIESDSERQYNDSQL